MTLPQLRQRKAQLIKARLEIWPSPPNDLTDMQLWNDFNSVLFSINREIMNKELKEKNLELFPK